MSRTAARGATFRAFHPRATNREHAGPCVFANYANSFAREVRLLAPDVDYVFHTSSINTKVVPRTKCDLYAAIKFGRISFAVKTIAPSPDNGKGAIAGVQHALRSRKREPSPHDQVRDVSLGFIKGTFNNIPKVGYTLRTA